MKNDPENTLLADLFAYETRVWDALVAGDAATDSGLLSEDFLGVYPDGFANKADHVGQLAQGATVDTFKISQCQAKPLGEGHAIFSYKAQFRRHGQPIDETMFVSSVWERTREGWINVFSQDTPCAGA